MKKDSKEPTSSQKEFKKVVESPKQRANKKATASRKMGFHGTDDEKSLNPEE
jgi:hypothetical protein